MAQQERGDTSGPNTKNKPENGGYSREGAEIAEKVKELQTTKITPGG